ncbi:MAG: bifunctional oligoribonuclease/PAP phosphatase NrnA [Clostridia bacterium]|nr:bifunctional oligoribonuclease/PAP phosphatase NrnA [Clostridia bacterium]
MNNKITISQLAGKIKEPKNTLILCHKNPDPDTLGSAFALKYILSYFGSEVNCACADMVAGKFSFITKGVELEYKGEEYERYIAVDVASPMQLGDLEYLSPRVDITIDHHEMNTRFSLYYEDFRASNCENIYLLAKELNVLDKMPLNFYECLYAGMSADTGGFRFSNVTPDTMKIASEVISHGIDHAEINRIIFDSKTMGEIRAQKLTYEKMQLFLDGKLSIIMFTNDMKSDNQITDADIGDIVNYIRSIEGVLVAVSLKQSSRDESKFSVSSRANVDIDVSMICAKIGGGGHKRAAGATIIASSPEEAIKRCVELFGEAIMNN